MNSANLFEDRHCFLNSFTFSSLNAVVKHFLFSILRWLIASDVLEEDSILICDGKPTPTRYLMSRGTLICRAQAIGIWRAIKISRSGRYIASCRYTITGRYIANEQRLRMGTVVQSVQYLKFLKPSAKFGTRNLNEGLLYQVLYNPSQSWHQ